MVFKVDPNRVKIFNEPRKDGDIDLADMVFKFLTKEISTDAGDIFRSDPAIIDVIPRPSSVQKVIIINYLSKLLFIYRSCGGENVTNVMSLLSGAVKTNVDGFMVLFTTYILPFLKENNVFGIYKKESND